MKKVVDKVTASKERYDNAKATVVEKGEVAREKLETMKDAARVKASGLRDLWTTRGSRSKGDKAPAWPPHSSTVSTAPHPHSLPLASSSASSLAAIFGGYQYSCYASNFTTDNPFASTVLHQPRQTPHIAEPPLATIAPQLTWGTPPTYTPTYYSPVIPQQNKIATSRLAKRHREKAEDSERRQGLKATTGKKRRAVSGKSRSHNPLTDIAEPQSSQHAAPPRVYYASPTRQPKKRSTRSSSQGDENIPNLDESRDSYGYMQGGRAETRLRSSALALAGSSGILNATSRTDVPNTNLPIGAGTPAPVPPGERTWCTPAFYEDLRNIARALVAQEQAATSRASDGVAQYGSSIDEGPPMPSLPGAPRAKRRRDSTEKTPAGSLRVASDGSHSTEGNSGSTAAVAQEKVLCPFADSSGVCDEPEPEKRSAKRRKVGVSASDNGPKPSKLSVFGRPTDLERHVLSRHLKVHVHCRRCYEANKPSEFARYDGFLRHLRDTCLRVKDTKISRKTSSQCAFIPMPCYRDPGGLFVRGLSGLRKTRTAFSLEESLRKYTKDIRRCECCTKLDDEEMDAIKAPTSTMGNPDVQPRTVSASASDGLDEDRLPPEEEEGVDEKPISESGHASNLDVSPLVSSTSYLSEMRSTVQEHGTVGFSDLEKQEKQGSLAHCGVVSADHDGTIQESDLDNTFYESVESLEQLLAQPWCSTDFGLEALEPDANWMGSS
ncbi:hypothetical protein V8D89_014485 [Ganoderma adspersum]